MPARSLLLAVVSVGALCVAGWPAKAEADGLPPGAIAVLSLIGAAPQYANERGFYDLGLSLPIGYQPATTLFAGLPDTPDQVEMRGWGLRPSLVMQGQYVGAHVALNFDFGRTVKLDDRLTLDRSFALNVRYHCGFNLLYALGRSSPVMLSVGPMLDVQMGPRLRLREREDGTTLGHAQWGRLGEIGLLPSATAAITRGPILMQIHGGWIPGIPPFLLIGYSAGEAGGTFVDASPDEPDLRVDGGDNAGEARRSLQRVKPSGGTIAGATIGLAPGRSADEPTLLLGFSATFTRRQYAVSDGGFGIRGRFQEDDLRFMVGLGAYFPNGVMEAR